MEPTKNPLHVMTTATVLIVLQLAILFAILFGSCAHFPSPVPGGATCAEVCDRAGAMGCDWAQPTGQGASCQVVCQNASDARVPWKLDCLAKVATCGEADSCN